jgi:glutathione S-transferase
MAIELYWGSGSTPSWRVLLALLAKGLPYTSHLISFSKRETRTPEFLALNPRGKVPTLKDGELVLNESLAILAYLDRRYPEVPLFGTTPEEAGQVWRWCLEFENHAGPTASAVIRPILFNTLAQDEAKVREGIPALHAELAAFDKAVAGGFLVGNRLSAADLVWFAGLQFVVRGATRPAAAPFDLGVYPFEGRYPNLLRWARTIESLPGYEATIPPHWLESDPPSPKRLA